MIEFLIEEIRALILANLPSNIIPNFLHDEKIRYINSKIICCTITKKVLNPIIDLNWELLV